MTLQTLLFVFNLLGNLYHAINKLTDVHHLHVLYVNTQAKAKSIIDQFNS